jgi:hypothetical protein
MVGPQALNLCIGVRIPAWQPARIGKPPRISFVICQLAGSTARLVNPPFLKLPDSRRYKIPKFLDISTSEVKKVQVLDGTLGYFFSKIKNMYNLSTDTKRLRKKGFLSKMETGTVDKFRFRWRKN